jgi:hypothetical protein
VSDFFSILEPVNTGDLQYPAIVLTLDLQSLGQDDVHRRPTSQGLHEFPSRKSLESLRNTNVHLFWPKPESEGPEFPEIDHGLL